jgi:hypothetical protein
MVGRWPALEHNLLDPAPSQRVATALPYCGYVREALPNQGANPCLPSSEPSTLKVRRCLLVSTNGRGGE